MLVMFNVTREGVHAMTKGEGKGEVVDLKGLLTRDEDFVRAAVEALVQAALEAEMTELRHGRPMPSVPAPGWGSGSAPSRQGPCWVRRPTRTTISIIIRIALTPHRLRMALIRTAPIPHRLRIALIPHRLRRATRLHRRTTRRRRITSRGTAGIRILGALMRVEAGDRGVVHRGGHVASRDPRPVGRGGHVTSRDPRPGGNGGGYSGSRYIQIVRLQPVGCRGGGRGA
jgi:hypothetical protein